MKEEMKETQATTGYNVSFLYFWGYYTTNTQKIGNVSYNWLQDIMKKGILKIERKV